MSPLIDGIKTTAGVLVLALSLFLLGCAGVDQSVPSSKIGDDVPWFVKAMVNFIREKNQLISDNLPDCEKTFTKVLQHLEKNFSELKLVATEFKKVDEQASAREKMETAHYVATHLGPFFEETMKLQKAFTRQCPAEFERITSVVKSLQDQSSPPESG